MTNDGRLIGTIRRECLDRVARRADLDHARCVYRKLYPKKLPS